jgi:hypothetical protein
MEDEDNEFDVVDVVSSAINGDVADLEAAFDSVLRQKLNTALEVRKQELGQNLGATEKEE